MNNEHEEHVLLVLDQDGLAGPTPEDLERAAAREAEKALAAATAPATAKEVP